MENKNEPQHKIVQTYAEDMASVLAEDKGGLIKKIIHGEEEHDKEKSNLSPQSRKNKIFLTLGSLFILASVGILFFFLLKREVPSVSVQNQFIPIIFTDKNTIVEISGLKKDEIPKSVLSGPDTGNIKEGGIEAIYLTINKNPVGIREFNKSIEGNFFPSEENFLENNFLMGVVKRSTLQNDFFILLKMRSVPDVFNLMREWEKKMFFDLHSFFSLELSPTTKYLLTKEFESGIVENKNARILYDDQKNIVLMYVFANNNSIIITKSEKATKEIMLRLASSEIKK